MLVPSVLSHSALLPLRLIACLALLLTACVARTAFTCETSSQCDLGSGPGTCESNGFCSAPDTACDSGRRYASDAPGDLAGQCVDGNLPPRADGSPDGSHDPDAATDAHPADAGPPDGAPDAQVYVDYTPSNFTAARLTAGTGTLRVRASDNLVEIDSVLGTVTRVSDGADLRPGGAAFVTLNPAGAPALGVLSVGAVEIEAGAQVRIKGTAAFALAVATDVHIAGSIDLRGGTGNTVQAGPGGFTGGKVGTPMGGGPCGGGFVDLLGDVGGGGGGHVAVGGNGGARGPVTGPQPGGTGGGVCGGATLSPLQGGSAGGAGGGGGMRGSGGGGGGALQISARGELLLSVGGVINAAGGGGGGGNTEDGGGGGGAGGAVLLEGKRVQIDGTLVANGGGGGAGANNGAHGANGLPGGVTAARAAGGARAGEGAAGGAGGAGGLATCSGDPGEAALGISSDDNAGGGGGGAGRLRLRATTIVKTGVLSPAGGLTEATL